MNGATLAAWHCPLCGGNGREAIPRPPRLYMRCQACGSLWLEPPPTESELADYYADGNFYAAASAAEQRQCALYRRRLEIIKKRLVSTGPLLDVGCADGLFIEEAKRAGWASGGVEPSAGLRERARARGLVVHDRLSATRSEGRNAVVTAWEVIEHALDPKAFLAEVASQLAPGGLLALSTPDAASWAARALGTHYPFASSPEHVTLYSRKALRRLLVSHGLVVVYERGFSGLGFREARAMLRRRLGVAFMALAPVVTAVFAVLDWLGQGTEMEFYAVKDGRRP